MSETTLASPPDPAAGARPGSSGSILIVDDEVFIRTALQLYLETLGYGVLVAENGQRAIEIFSDPGSSVDVVILDLVMPGIQGIEVLKVLKSRNASVEVIIATGCGSMGTAIEALRYGAFDYITKPIVNFDRDLLQVVQEALRARREKLKQAKGAGPGREETSLPKDRLVLLDGIVEIAEAANGYHPGDPILERMENLLHKHFSVMGGLVLARRGGRDGGWTPLHSWGLRAPPSPPPAPSSPTEALGAVTGPGLTFFPTGSLDAERLGLRRQEIAGWKQAACLPLRLRGQTWGALLVFFSDALPRHLSGPPERHPFQVLSPILASVFSGAFEPPF